MLYDILPPTQILQIQLLMNDKSITLTLIEVVDFFHVDCTKAVFIHELIDQDFYCLKAIKGRRKTSFPH